MREIRQSGSEGGVALTPPSLPLSTERVDRNTDDPQAKPSNAAALPPKTRASVSLPNPKDRSSSNVRS